MTHAMPAWVVAGASVVEVNRGHRWATIVRVTPTGLVRLDNGASYKLASHGRSLEKTGERGPWFGSARPTTLIPAEEHLWRQSRAILSSAVEKIRQLDVHNNDPASVLAQMQTAVDNARAELAKAGEETADAGRRTADAVAVA